MVQHPRIVPVVADPRGDALLPRGEVGVDPVKHCVREACHGPVQGAARWGVPSAMCPWAMCPCEPTRCNGLGPPPPLSNDQQ